MQSKETGPSATRCLFGDVHTLNFEQVLKKFTRDIEALASRYPKSWRKDFCQEGEEALFNAYQKFIVLPPAREFRPYALRAIRNRMIDFFKKNLDPKKSIQIQDAIFVDDEGQEQEHIYNYSNDFNYFITTTFDMDYLIIFNPDNLKAKAFTESEIRVFHLYFIEDLPSNKVAKEMGITPGRVSQLVQRLRNKTELILKHYNPN